MAVYKDRKLVPKEETWDIESLLGGKPLRFRIEEVVKATDGLLALFKRRFDGADALHKYLEASYAFAKQFALVTEYLQLRAEQDTIDAEAVQALGEISLRLQPFSVATSGADAEDLKNRKKLEGFLKEKRFAAYRRHYELLFRSAPHVLPEDQEQLLARLSGAFEENGSIHGVLTDVETKFADAEDSKGKKRPVTVQTISKLMEDADRHVRKTASASYAAGQTGVRETAGRLVGGHFLAEFREAQLRNFPDHIAASMFDDNVEPPLVEKMYEQAKQSLAPYKRYVWGRRAFMAKALGIRFDDFKPYDARAIYVKAKNKFSVKEAVDLVQKSVAVLGDGYAKAVRHAFSDRWIDFHKTPNKRSGAFSAGGWHHPRKFILTNFDENLDSVFTLAHEMGHSMHTHHNDEANPPPLTKYPTFVAEVASIFSELMLMEHLLKVSKDDKLRYLALEGFLDNFVGTVYRQLEFSEYEYRAMQALKENKSLASWQALAQIYFDVHMQYSPNQANSLLHRDRICLLASHVPHYFYGFYVYKYATGMIAALSLMANLKKDARKGADSYLAFIRSGTNEWPADILKKVGADVADPKTHELAYGLFADYVEQYVALGERLFKVKAPDAKEIESHIAKGVAAFKKSQGPAAVTKAPKAKGKTAPVKAKK